MRLWLLVLPALLVACSGSSDASIPSRNGTSTTTSPNLPASACTELLRCGDDAQPRIDAAVCGDLERDNTLSGDVISGDDSYCVAAPSIDRLVAAAPRTGADRSFENVSQPTMMSFACAQYRFSALGINNTFELDFTGDAVIIVEGNVHIASPVRLVVPSGSTLDFVVGGDLEIDNTLTIDGGGTTWLGVGGNVHVASPTTIHGWLVAPDSHVEADNTLVVDSLLAGSMKVASPVTITGALGLSGDGCVAP